MSAPGEVIAVSREPLLQWPAIIAGAICAAGVSFTLHAFAAGVGLSVLSTAPTWRDSSSVYWMLSGLYLLFAALAAFGLGGYVAGRLRAPLDLAGAEMEFRDGMHGVVTWALAVVLAAVLTLAVAAAAAPALAPSGGQSGAAQSVAGENIIASELDELFRTDRPVVDIAYRRAEAARILLKSSSHNGVPNSDRNYLTSLTATITGMPIEEARAHVDHEIAAAGQELHKARMALVLQAFFVGVALMVGAAAAWFAAVEGGREREDRTVPMWDWSFHRRRPVRG